MKNPKFPRIVIVMEGGLIQAVYTDRRAEYVQIDFDAREYGDKEDIRIIKDTEGNDVEVFEIHSNATEDAPKVVNHFYRQIKTQTRKLPPENNCDWAHQTREEVRLLPTGGGGNMILCRKHFNVEMKFRMQRNLEADDPALFKIERWEDLKIYKGE